MSKPILTTTADQKLDEVNHHFEVISGLPVVDDQLRCIGVIAKRDIAKASQGVSLVPFPMLTIVCIVCIGLSLDYN